MKAILTSLFVVVSGLFLLAQETEKNLIRPDSICKIDTVSNQIPHSFLATGAFVSYYFWEEDSLGYIKNQEIKQPFLQNYYITSAIKNGEKYTINYPDLKTIINSFAHDFCNEKEKHSFEIFHDSKKEKLHFPLIREPATSSGSIIFVKKNESWTSRKRHSVLYFTISSDNKWRFSYSSDSIILNKHNIRFASNGQYLVLTYVKDDKHISKQDVYTFAGENVTEFFLEAKSMIPQRVIVFANGYRGPTRDKDESDHLVTSKDRYYYWFKIDNQFIKRLEPAASYYIDGSMGINTSNHKTMVRFTTSYLRSTFVFRKRWSKKKFNALNTSVNVEGFNIRKENGRIAGKAFLTALCNSPACQKTIDTVDIVSHSMGYAYSLGFIEEIKGKVVFGKMYILAPENASTDCVDWSMFEEVWQYGSNLDQENPDPVWEQDGIAPQCQVKGLDSLALQKGGRAFIPKDWPRKNFVDSHQLYNFDWIFERINVGEAGYISR